MSPKGPKNTPVVDEPAAVTPATDEAETTTPVAAAPSILETERISSLVKAAVDKAVAQLGRAITEELDAQREMFNGRIAGFREEFGAMINQLGLELERARERLDAASSTGMKIELSNLQGAVERIANMLGRHDIISPPASVEQIEEALKQRARLRILNDYQTPTLRLSAGRVIEGQSFNHQTLLDGVRSGKLKVSVLPPEGG